MTTILIVDDEPSAVSGLRSLLQLDGYDVTGCESSGEAIALLSKQPFDGVITDLEMPGAGGVAVARAALAARPLTLVLVLTGYANSPAAAAALAVGARRVFEKPLDYDVLAAELRAALGDA